MKFESTRRHSAGLGGGNASSTGGGVSWNGMSQYRFSSGEVRTIQIGYALIVFSIGLFAFLSNTMLLPALRNQSLQSTECFVVRSEVVRVPINSGKVGDRCVKEGYLCLKVHVVYNTNAGGEDIKEYSDEIGPSNKNMKFHRGRHDEHFNAAQNPGSNGDYLKQLKPIHVMQAVLRYDELQLSWGARAACTVRPTCPDSPANNYPQMMALQRSLGRPGLHIPCFYDPRNFADVILRKKYGKKTIANCIFWPSLILGVGVLILTIIYCCIGRFKSKIGAPSKIMLATKESIKGIRGSLRRFTRSKSPLNSQKRPGNGRNLCIGKFRKA